LLAGLTLFVSPNQQCKSTKENAWVSNVVQEFDDSGHGVDDHDHSVIQFNSIIRSTDRHVVFIVLATGCSEEVQRR